MTKKKFKVFTKSIGYCYAIVEADDIASANEIADEMDGGDFTEYDVGWEIEEDKTRDITDEKNEPKPIEYEFVHASQVFYDDNGGLVFGVNWIDDDGEIADCEWFSTKEARDLAVTGFEGIE